MLFNKDSLFVLIKLHNRLYLRKIPLDGSLLSQ